MNASDRPHGSRLAFPEAPPRPALRRRVDIRPLEPASSGSRPWSSSLEFTFAPGALAHPHVRPLFGSSGQPATKTMEIGGEVEQRAALVEGLEEGSAGSKAFLPPRPVLDEAAMGRIQIEC